MNAEVTPFDQRIVRPLMPELDTIRGIAVLVVFWYHGFMLFTPASSGAPAWERIFITASRQGWAGVNLFFVLSGFLITGILLDSANKPNFYSRFYYRRALRILPAYYLLLLMLIVLGHISFMPRHTSFAFVALSFIYLSNITPLLGIPLEYGPLWSLAVEEHFYILWPAAVRTLTRRNLTIVAGSICVLEPFIRIYCVHRGGLWWSTYTWVSADGLALGGLLAIFGRSAYASRANLLKLVILAAVVAIGGMAVSVVVPRAVQVGIRGTCVNYFAFAIVGAILWLGTGAHRGLVNLRFLSFFGFISYGLYLIHMLGLDLYNGAAQQFFPSLSVGTSFPKYCLRLLIVMAAATATAYVSRVTYEEFFLRLKDKRLKARRTGAHREQHEKIMVETLKSLAKSLPYPVFLRLFYAWDRLRSWPRAEAARRQAGIPRLDQVDLLQIKSSETLFVLGSGPSINRISSERWRLIAGNDTVGFNWWLYHSFVPKFYFLEVIEKDGSPEAFDAYLSLAGRRAADYTPAIKVAMEFHRPGAQTLAHLPPAFRTNLFAAQKIEAPARNEDELARALRYLQARGAFQVTGRFSSLLKYAASLTTMLVFALKLGYKRVVLCGVDLKTPDYFFQDRRLYPESWEPPVMEHGGSHDTDVPLLWRVPVTRAVAVIKQQLLDPAGVKLYVESQDSALWPMLPALPGLASDVPLLSKTSSLQTASSRSVR